MTLSKKRITKALIKLRKCAGWSAPLLLKKPEDRVSHAEVLMISDENKLNSIKSLMLFNSVTNLTVADN